MIYTCSLDTPLGAMRAAQKDNTLVGLWFIGQKYFPRQTANWIYAPDQPIFIALRNYLADYFAGNPGTFAGRLNPQGSPFQKTVWDILLQIPLGQVATYGQIARWVACKQGLPSMSAQAVGGAVGHNPIGILIPCHRVVGFDGNLTGYAGGLDKKKALLQIEKVNLEKWHKAKWLGKPWEKKD
ncbi:methylated-DNA--[protein]-cysteine S-methyltransferase [Sporomusa acidovorans]|uniref:Methylated-DNA--protein-cysteine methyltransferase n=1 Tax=Sporomusa acidovorans (strain ATCC 49682 / DSM 3132 / Mol) TaxID=1123286 RepID=A0ABZ3J200_SPOA4|nr:methylated-DNA--[protein]-cysteine S-methyltransferase [Sporomusa acidovorans]OZC24102.1 methylated-DNA--protein-cysteine methyltransferase [Sporomusa acidovorans DSM 3132]SDF69083.1 methylated-DNA-[protein]-cysteine S-methyltransferase [Sporomusa acidovorans]